MQQAPGTPRNRLLAETSPYLQQHAHNPVDWYPWGPEALERARLENKPILLSIGYSACHWCHVMAHESFEDPAIAALLNEEFINVKVDREERPDLDRIYQLSLQLLTQQTGGWPLTMFLAPDDHLPFYGGTYFPPVRRHGSPAFREVLERVLVFFREHQVMLHEQGGRLMQVFQSLTPTQVPGAVVLDRAPLARARADLETKFDTEFGGFTAAPKFPHVTFIERLLRHWSASALTEAPDLKALYMATLTLTRMAEGGIYDHVGGGFARYSVDRHFMIPHFEKMLYDNGPLLAVYADAALATGDPLFRATANGIADWALAEMQAPAGGFYSSIDADSEGEEGKFYVWERTEVEKLLTAQEYAALAPRFGLDREPNFEKRCWHLHAYLATAEIARNLGVAVPLLEARIASGLAKLKRARGTRVAPGRDEKILCSWNALMIRGLAIAGRALKREDLTLAATRAVDFLREELWQDGRLYATHRDGRSHVLAYIDDYIFLADAVLELLVSRWRSADLDFVVALVEAALAQFEDPNVGGFWFTANDAEPLIHRPKSFQDEALPAANGVAARLLGRLGYLLGEPRYLEAAERTLRAAWVAIDRYPTMHASLLDALEEVALPIETVILRGPAGIIEVWRQELARLYAPRRKVFAIPDTATGLPPALAAKVAGSKAIAYVCRGPTCGPPLESFTTLVGALGDGVGHLIAAGTQRA